jgi:hypothetical protein
MNENNLHPPEDWWSDDQKALVWNTSPIWKRQKFQSTAGVWIPLNGGGRLLRKFSKDDQIPEGAVLDNSAWDHENCALCWQKISEYPTDQHDGYINGESWLCEGCYDKYIGGAAKK